MSDCRKIGILGGTFNPVHNGHIRLAQICYDKLSLDEILVIPTNIPPHKSAKNIADSGHRLNMLKLAFEDLSYVSISDIELNKEGKSYTVETLSILKEKYPNDSLYLIVGGDMFLCFDEWKDYKKILSMCTLCTAPRENGELIKLKEYQNVIDPSHTKTIIFESDILVVSSTEIRNSDILDIKEIPQKVKEYIIQKGLYKNG